MKKKLISALAIIVMASTILSACDDSTKADPTTTTPAATTAKETVEGETTAEGSDEVVFTDGLSGVNQFPFVEETTEFKIAFPYYPYIMDVDTNEQAVYIEEVTGLDIIWDILPESGSDEKINLMIAGGQGLPDLFASCTGTFTSSFLATLGTQNLVAPLNDLIDKWQYNFAELLEEQPDVLQQLYSPDGNIYFMPQYSRNEPNAYAQRFWINKTFMEALDIDKVPETVDEYYDYLVAVKEGDPNGNGKADEVPVAAAPVNNGWHENIDGFLMEPFVYMDVTNGTNANSKRRIFMTEDGKVEYAATQEGYKEGLKFLNKLFEENLMSTEVFTMAKEDLRALVELEECVVGSLPSGGPHEFANTSGERRKDYVIVPPLEGPDGTRQAYWEEYSGVTVGAYVVPSASDKQDIAMKLIDFMYTAEMHLWNRYGVEGRDWQRPAEGVKAWNGGQAMMDTSIGNLVWGESQNVYLANRMPGWSRFGSNANVATDDPYNLEKVLWDAHLEYIPYATGKRVPPLNYTDAEAREYTEISNTLHQYVEQSLAEFVTGARDIDAGWDDYVAECQKIGVDRMMEINQTAFDRQWADTWTWKAN